MTTFLIILLVAAVIATVVALIRGIVAFLKVTEAELKGDGPGKASVQSNKMMQQRILFQAIAVVICVLLLLASGRG